MVALGPGKDAQPFLQSLSYYSIRPMTCEWIDSGIVVKIT